MFIFCAFIHGASRIYSEDSLDWQVDRASGLVDMSGLRMFEDSHGDVVVGKDQKRGKQGFTRTSDKATRTVVRPSHPAHRLYTTG